MSKKNRYIIVGICLIVIALCVTIYSTYTYSTGETEDTNIINDVINEELKVLTYSGLLESISPKDQVDTYVSLVAGEDTVDTPSQYTMNNVPKNRVQIGPTCWAFSSLNAMETTIANKELDTTYGKTKRINPYHMIHALNQKIGNDKNIYGYRDEKNQGGGTPFNTLLYLTNGTGFTISESFYYNQNNHSSSDYSNGSLTLNNVINSNTENYQVKTIQIIPGISTSTLNQIGLSNFPNNQQIKSKIQDIKNLIEQGLGVTITSRSTQRSENPCYMEDVHSAYCPKELINLVGAHMTLIVGWDDNYSKDNFKKTVGDINNPGPPADGAWKIRNSYSYDGYYYISYYDYTTLYNSNIVVTSVGVKNFDNIYQYNPSGCDGEYNCFELENIRSNVINVYTKKTNKVEEVKSISFYADRVSSNNEVEIYLKEGNINTANLSNLFSQENYIGKVSINANGFYTYDLTPSQTVKISKSKFYVGLKPKNGQTLKIQGKSNILATNSEVGITEGVSYYYNGSTYKDLFNYSTQSTAFIKVYTKTTNEIPQAEEINYTVKYYLEKLDGTYELNKTEKLTGVIGDKAVLENYDGFTKPSAIELTENTTLVEYKYKRKSYTVTLSKIKGISDVTGGGSYKHGANVTINATIANGYTWSKWIGESSITTKKYTFVMPKHDVMFTATAVKENSSEVKVTGVTINKCPTSPIKVGSTVQLSTTITPSSATNKNIVWSVPSFDVVTINSNGKVQAVKNGIATITVTTVDGELKDTCKITVSDEITENGSANDKRPIKFEEKEISILKDSEYKLNVTVTSNNKKIIWQSSNEEIAIVEDGLVKGINVGIATITAKLDGTKDSASIDVKVTTNEESGIKFENSRLDIYLNIEKELKIITTPTNMVIEEIEYTLEDENIAMITNNVITGLKIGSTKLTVKVNNKYEASTTIHVHDEPLRLIIPGYNINVIDNKYTYELEINNEKELNITSNKEITIEGNLNLKDGSIIKITNLETNEEYQIKIIKKNTYKYIFISLIGLLILINIMRIIKNKIKIEASNK